MAQNLAFGRSGGSSSWADDDDADFPPIPAAPKLPIVEEKQPIEEEEIHAREQRRDDGDRAPRGGRDDRRGDRDDRRSGGYDDRRGGGYDDRRGDRDDRRAPREERPKNPVPDHPPYKLFVGNLPFRMTEDDLADFLNPEGIRDIHFPRDFETDRPKGYAYVEFDSREALVRALELDGQSADGRAVKIDVASARDRDRRPRQQENSWFSDKRPERTNDRRQPADEGNPRERPKISLLPRSSSTEPKDGAATKPSIFGDAKPRDEAAYLERQKAREAERKKEAAEAKAKREAAKKEKEAAKAKAEAEAAAAPPAEKKHERHPRKDSHDDAAPRAGGRGRGRGDKSHPERRVEGGRGHARQDRSAAPKMDEPAASARKTEPRAKRTELAKSHPERRDEGGRGHARQDRSAAPKKDEPAASARKTEPRAKRTEPPKAKIAPPATTKTKNVFGLLRDDSDSD